jgi:hypothetical protein
LFEKKTQKNIKCFYAQKEQAIDQAINQAINQAIKSSTKNVKMQVLLVI